MMFKKIKKIFFVCFTFFICFSCRSWKVQEPDPFLNSIRPKITGEWFLTSMEDAAGKYDILDGVTINFPETPRNAVNGCAGENYYNGNADVYEVRFVPGAFAVTKISSSESILKMEEKYLELLKKCNKVRTETEISNESGVPVKKLIIYNKEELIYLNFVK